MTDISLDIARLGGATMGTTWSVSLVAPRQRDLHPLHAGIQARLDEVVAQMSTWEPASDISRYNRADAGQWFTLPTETRHVLACALAVAAASEGAFDPSVGPLVALWGFGAHAGGRHAPAADILQATRARCGWQRLQWQGNALLQPGGLELDLSAIAKGFGVDHVATWLRDQGIGAALVEVGGELA
ncbi:MAG: FAD:protein FMN transferase, partial [Stenotrophomonas sp.]